MKLFVYGTLLSPFSTSSLIPTEAYRQPAVTVGRMYHYLPGCYPAITIPSTLIQASGTMDYAFDEAVERGLDAAKCDAFGSCDSISGSGIITGELVEFFQPGAVMARIDRYEGFQEDKPLYRRSLVPVKAGRRMVWAWVYHFDEHFPFEQAQDMYLAVSEGNWLEFLQRL